MMEPITTPMMHISESKAICSSLSCSTSENDEISKKLEDELLYGVDDDDADEEDALSDDSLRLRLSDDEADGDDNHTAISSPINNQLKIVKTELSADSCTQETGENSNETKSENQKNESNFNNNNFTKINFKLSNVNTEPDSSTQEPTTIVLDSCTSEVQDQIMIIENNDTENILKNVNDTNKSESKPISIVNNDSSSLQKDHEQKSEDQLTSVQNTTDTVNSDSNKLNVEENTRISDNHDQIKLNQHNKVQNDPLVQIPETNLKDDVLKGKNNLNEEQKDNSVTKEISDSKVIDTIPIKQEIASPKLDSTEKTNNKRRLSESDSDEITMREKVPCQELVESPSKPVAMQENVTVKICQGPDGVSELEKIMESEGKTISDENSLKNNFLNGDSCSPDMENTTLSVKTSKEENNKNDEHMEKEDEIDKSHGESIKGKRRRKRRKTVSPSTINQYPIHFPIQEKENVRQKRETAQKAQEMIRKLNNNSDSDSDEKLSKVTYKSRNSHPQPLSPPTLKRNLFENEEGFDGTSKKSKGEVETKHTEKVESVANENKQTLDHVRKFFLRDTKQKLAKLTQEQLEELLIQKVIETITMRDEIGKLREQARISERNQEATRVKCQQLAKQIKDFEMVLTRFAADRRTNEKTATPIKINRSVGLQVSFVTESGIQNLRQINNMKSNQLPNGINALIKPNDESVTRKGIKVRSPRRPEISISTPVTSISSVPNTQVSINSSISAGSLSSRGLVITKAVDPRPKILTNVTPSVVNQQLPNQALTLNVHGVSIHPSNPNHQTKVLNVHSKDNNSSNNNTTTTTTATTTITTTTTTTTTTTNNNNNNNNKSNNINSSINNSGANSNINTNTTKSKSANLIDLTEEEEKNKLSTEPPPLSTISVQTKDLPTASNTSPRYQRIVQQAPANVTLSQPAIKVIQPTDKPTPTALVNNVTASPRLTLVMKGGVVQPQLIIANTNQIRPVVNTAPRPSFPGITYSGVVSGQTIPNGQVRVVPASNVTTAQKPKHPAALPPPQKYPVIASLKLPPPAPSLKISKAPNGIVLSWNMALSDKYAEIASYQLYAYQEVTGMQPRPTLWRKVGDVRALALPMACTLTQFTEGNTYYFAVRAVDTHSRVGSYSRPGSIFL